MNCVDFRSSTKSLKGNLAQRFRFSLSVNKRRGSEQDLLERMKKRSGFSGCMSFLQWRYVIVVCCFLGAVNLYILRVNLSVAVVAMVNQTFVTSRENNTADHMCAEFITNSSRHVVKRKGGDFDWEPQVQGIVLGGFYYGYILTQLLGGILIRKIPARFVFGIGVLAPSLLAFLTPAAAYRGPYWLLALRILQGMFEGMCIPALSALIVRWMPPLEVTRAMGAISSGYNIGTVIAMIFSGLICDSPMGWPAVFYFSGGSGVLWFILWVVLVRDSPAQHPFISDSERQYIKSSQCMSVTNKVHSIPWRQILFSRAVLPYYFCTITSPFIFYTGLSAYPTYMEEILHFTIDQNGTLSSLPYICGAVSIMCTSLFVDDVLRKRRIMTTTGARKFVQFVGQTVCVCTMVSVPLVGCRRWLAVSLLMISSVGGSMTGAAYEVAPLDIAPNHVGILLGISNTLSSVAGFVGPFIMGALTNDEQTLTQFLKVFAIASGICYCGTIVFCLFGTCEVQWWNDSSKVIRSIQEDLGSGSGYQDSSGEHDSDTRPLIPEIPEHDVESVDVTSSSVQH